MIRSVPAPHPCFPGIHPAWVLACGLSLLVPVPADAATIILGPYVRDLHPDGATIAWETDEPATGTLDVGATPALGSSVPAVSDGTRHHARVHGLPPGTLRHYRARVNGEPAGRAGTFVTPPEGEAPFTFLVYGDSRSDPDAHRLVVSRMLEHPAAFVVNTGDLVTQGDHEDEWIQLFDILRDLAGDTLLLANVGNHDLESVSPPTRFAARLGGVAPDGALQTWRRFDFGGSRFLVLDNFDAVLADMDCFMRTGAFSLCLNPAQAGWLDGELDAARKDPSVRHVFVFVHEGPYSSKPGRSGSPDLRWWQGRFAESKVRAVISGHDHYYEHGRAGNGMDYIITGGGGAPLYETVPEVKDGDPPHEILTSTSLYHFLRVTVDRDRIDVTVFQADGTEIESYGLNLPVRCKDPADCTATRPGSCAGAWACASGECAWACTPPPECSLPEECEWRDPGDCPGTWSCVEAKCRWTCEAKDGGDAGFAAGDAAPAAGDAGPQAMEPDAGAGPVATSDPGTTSPADAGSTPPGKARGCSASGATSTPWWWWLVAAAVGLEARRRRAASLASPRRP